jgi:hypothetical protein
MWWAVTHSQMRVCQQQLLLRAGFEVANTACRALQNHTSTVACCDQAAQLPRTAQQTDLSDLHAGIYMQHSWTSQNNNRSCHSGHFQEASQSCSQQVEGHNDMTDHAPDRLAHVSMCMSVCKQTGCWSMHADDGKEQRKNSLTMHTYGAIIKAHQRRGNHHHHIIEKAVTHIQTQIIDRSMSIRFSLLQALRGCRAAASIPRLSPAVARQAPASSHTNSAHSLTQCACAN